MSFSDEHDPRIDAAYELATLSFEAEVTEAVRIAENMYLAGKFFHESGFVPAEVSFANFESISGFKLQPEEIVEIVEPHYYTFLQKIGNFGEPQLPWQGAQAVYFSLKRGDGRSAPAIPYGESPGGLKAKYEKFGFDFLYARYQSLPKELKLKVLRQFCIPVSEIVFHYNSFFLEL